MDIIETKNWGAIVQTAFRRAIERIVSVGFAACAAVSVAGEATYSELYRPQIHYSPPEHWMNDPNGLVQVGGRYQMYYQYHPYSSVWGPMHWGHADSADLLHWVTYPWVLGPDERGAIFSGSAVLDPGNTAGLGAAGSSPLIAIYTYHNHDIEANHGIAVESQGLAYSLDQGKTFAKYPKIILQNPGTRNFRDPNVHWFEPTQRWIMTLVATDHVEFYSSRNLKDWDYESGFGAGRGAHGGVWECPDLMRMQAEPGGETRDVLLVSTNPGGPGGGGGTQYFVGHFDGHHFTEDVPDGAPQWLDYGPDYYAAVTWNRDHHGNSEPPVVLGWMNDWRYAIKTPTSPWRSAMAIPRELHLLANGTHHRMTAVPIPAVTSLASHSIAIANRRQLNASELLQRDGKTIPALDFNLVVDSPRRAPFELRLHNRFGQSLLLQTDPSSGEVRLDRSQSGKVDFDASFTTPVNAPARMPESGRLSIRLLVDQSSVEVFLNDGETDITAQVFPDAIFDQIDLSSADEAVFRSGTVSVLRSVWGNESSTGEPLPH